MWGCPAWRVCGGFVEGSLDEGDVRNVFVENVEGFNNSLRERRIRAPLPYWSFILYGGNLCSKPSTFSTHLEGDVRNVTFRHP
jgi:hypothetical protein